MPATAIFIFLNRNRTYIKPLLLEGDGFSLYYKRLKRGTYEFPVCTMTLTHEEFLRRFEQHILPTRFVRIRHGGYLAHNEKNNRIAAILLQLQLPKPMPKVIIPFSLQMLQRTGIDYSICPKCKAGKMEITASYLNHNGSLVKVKDSNRAQNKKQSIATDTKNYLYGN